MVSSKVSGREVIPQQEVIRNRWGAGLVEPLGESWPMLRVSQIYNDPDVNAVGPNGDLFEAGQMVTEGDAELRRSLDIE